MDYLGNFFGIICFGCTYGPLLKEPTAWLNLRNEKKNPKKIQSGSMAEMFGIGECHHWTPAGMFWCTEALRGEKQEVIADHPF